jgi:hypothetical protein
LQPRKSGLARTAREQGKTASSAGGNQKKEPNQEMPDHGQNEDRRKRPSRNRLSGGSSLNRREEKSQHEQRMNLSTKPKAEICKHEVKDTFSDLQDR